MLFQVLFHCLDFAGVSRAKPSLFVDIDDIGVLEMENHIGVMVAIDIHKTERNRDELLAIPVELRAEINAGLRGVSAGKLNYLDPPVEVQRDNVAPGACLVVLA